MNAPSVNQNQAEEVNNEQSSEKPKEEANNQEPEEVQPPQQEQVDVQVPKEEDPILKVRKRNEFELIETDMGIYGPDMVAFLKARAAKKRAKTDLREANAIYQKAKADLEALRDNFNAAFESSAEKEN